MFELTALIVVTTLYIIPGNIFLYGFSEKTVGNILLAKTGFLSMLKSIPFVPNLLGGTLSVAASVLYCLFVLIYFAALYLIVKFVIIRALYVFNDKELEGDTLLIKYNRGQNLINGFSRFLLTAAIAVHLILKIYDIKIFVFYVLSVTFIFVSSRKRKLKSSKEKTNEDSKAEVEISTEETNKGLGTRTEVYSWDYSQDALSIEQPTRFTAKITINTDRYKEYIEKEHVDNSPEALRKYVIEGLCPEVMELSNQIKKICTDKNFTTYHQVSAVMALQQSFKYVYDKDSKGVEEYIRYPLETLSEREGDCDCHSTCSAAILYSMGYDVVLLRIIYPDKSGHLAIAVEGADGIPGNFFRHKNRKYYYCEVTPSEEGSMNFKVGEMPEMPGANITIVPVKEVVSNSSN